MNFLVISSLQMALPALMSIERVHLQLYPTRQDAYFDVFHYIEMFYNTKLLSAFLRQSSKNVNPKGSGVSSQSAAIERVLTSVNNRTVGDRHRSSRYLLAEN